jgi:cobyrinic acid a,c-diamide synthase
MHTPAIAVAGTHSGVGKTTISIALMAALRRRGMRVQPFKVGPDFLDPTLHARASGRVCYSLDGWMLGRDASRSTYARAVYGVDVAILEGVMGLFDGRDGTTDAGSTAEMAKLLGLPTVLVVDASAMARSAAALVHGFESFDPGLAVAGIVFNRVGGEGHFAYLRDAVEASCAARVLGWLPVDEAVTLPERYLGLHTGDEVLTGDRLDALASWIERGLDVRALVDLAREATGPHPEAPEAPPVAPRARIGVARDAAFSFYYQENLDMLSRLGAETIEFSPVADAHLPGGLDGLYLGGGYPELHAADLAANARMRAEILAFSRGGRPVYAECGGFMYLTEAIVDAEGREHAMVGVFPTRARLGTRLAVIGYREVEGVGRTGWLREGVRARGHEFRYSTIDPMPGEVERGFRPGPMEDGYRVGSTLGGYVHIHFASCPSFAARFVDACAERVAAARSQEVR